MSATTTITSTTASAAAALALLLALAAAPAARAADGRLLATGGATTIEGQAGGGIVPWAVLAGYAAEDEVGATAVATRVQLPDYALDVIGASLTVRNRVELSWARQDLDLDGLRRALGLPFRRLRQDVFGLKVRVAGDLVYTPWPQVSVGLQHKRHLDFTLPGAVGARDDAGTDVLVSASKLVLAGAGGYHLLLNGTARRTRANQGGLLGFGGDRRDDAQWVGEGSVAVLLNPRWAVGLEYRQMPDNLGFAREEDWRDAFVAWFPNKRVAVVAAWADLGDVATRASQRGAYLSVQVSL